MMNNKVYLYIPKSEELEYRQRIMSQPETMNYNKGYDISFEGYHQDTGCIDFPKEKWNSWYANWINNKPKYFYAYITTKEDNKFIGEVNLHLDEENNWYEMGVVIEGKYRGQGYSLEALAKLLQVAFEEYKAIAVHNDFEITRQAAIAIHKKAGFKIINESKGIVELLITKDDYENSKIIK